MKYCMYIFIYTNTVKSLQRKIIDSDINSEHNVKKIHNSILIYLNYGISPRTEVLASWSHWVVATSRLCWQTGPAWAMAGVTLPMALPVMFSSLCIRCSVIDMPFEGTKAINSLISSREMRFTWPLKTLHTSSIGLSRNE